MTVALLAQYDALRHGVGAYHLARDVVVVRGSEAVSYLQGQCSQDVAALEVGASADALLLAPDGKLDALVRVTRTGSDAFAVDTDGGTGDLVASRLKRFKLRTKVDIEGSDWACVALRGGEEAVATLADATGGAVLRVKVDWHGWRGVDLLGPAESLQVPEGAVWCGDEAWQACRVESAVPVMGRELDAQTIAAEADLVERCVSFTKGCYTGQELVARLDARGSRVARRLHGVVLEPDSPVGAHELVGAELQAPGHEKVLGSVTSAAWCPGLGAVAGLAYGHRSLPVPGPVALRLRGHQGDAPVPAELLALPLV